MKHNVYVVDNIKELFYNEAYNKAKEKVILMDGETFDVETNAYAIGFVIKDGEHYFLSSDGVGSSTPIEYEDVDIFWYVQIFKNDRLFSVSMFPDYITRMTKDDLPRIKVSRVVPLEDFIRVGGSRLKVNLNIWQNFLDGDNEN